MLKKVSMISAFMASLFIVYINFSTVSTHYVCQEDSTEAIPKQLFITVEQHHALSAIWNNYNGQISYEIPLSEKGRYAYHQEANQLKIFNSSDSTEQGIYSKLKNFVTINTSTDTFKGSCVLLNESCSNNILH